MEALEIKGTKKVINASNSMLEDSTFSNVCLNRMLMDDVAVINAKITNANLSNLEIENAQIGGAYFHDIGMPPEGTPYYNPEAIQNPVRFDNCDLHGTVITDCNLKDSNISDCNLSNVSISDCNLKGMQINGIAVEDLLSAYHRQSS